MVDDIVGYYLLMRLFLLKCLEYNDLMMEQEVVLTVVQQLVELYCQGRSFYLEPFVEKQKGFCIIILTRFVYLFR